MRRLAFVALLLFAACRSAPLVGAPRTEPGAVAASSAPTAVPEARRDPAAGGGTAGVMVQTIGNLRGRRGQMRYAGDVVAIDGVSFRAQRKAFRLPAGRHVITVAWRNYQVPVWGGVGCDLEGPVLFLQEGVGDTEIVADANRFYEVIWPEDDKPGGPDGFRDVTMPR